MPMHMHAPLTSALPPPYKEQTSLFLEILRNNSRNFPIVLLNIFKLFLKNSGNISRYVAKFFKAFKVIFDIFRNDFISKILETILKILRNIFRESPKYFVKYLETF